MSHTRMRSPVRSVATLESVWITGLHVRRPRLTVFGLPERQTQSLYLACAIRMPVRSPEMAVVERSVGKHRIDSSLLSRSWSRPHDCPSRRVRGPYRLGENE